MSKSTPNNIKPVKIAKENNDTAETDISLEKIRQAGICRHYEQLRDQGLSAKECLEITAEFARISERQAKGILTGNIQITGKKANSVSDYFAEIEEIEFELAISRSSIKRRSYPEIRRDIEKDPKLNDEEKQALKSEIDCRIQEAEERTHTQNTPIEEPQFNSLAEAINSFDTEEQTTVKPQPKSLDDAIKKFDTHK
jgi:hypothetical protein